MFWNKKKTAENEIYATQSGTIVPIADVPDPVFSEKILGDGVAIIPESGRVVSPVNGKVINVADTLHAFGLETAGGIEILVHIGVNTVELKGKGFTPKVRAGDTVKVGTPLCEVDLSFIRQQGYETYTPILITNMDQVNGISIYTGCAVAGKTCVMSFE